MHEVLGAKVGHVLSTLKQAGRQHAIVVEIHEPSFHDRLVMLPQVIARRPCAACSRRRRSRASSG